jgi:hypothetical protein
VPTGIIVILSIALPIVMVVVIMTALMKGQAKTDELLRTGLPARGRILQLGTTGGSVAVMGHRHLNLILTVEVQSPINGAVYTTNFQQLVSELQIPSVQPGALVELRIDPHNPQRIALAGTLMQGQQGFPQQQGYRQPGVGQPMGVNVMTPNYKSALPRIIIMMLVTTLPIAIIMGYVFVDWDSLLGRNSTSDAVDDEDETAAPAKKKTKSKGVCARAAACCKVLAQGAGAQACENYEKDLMPVEGCKQALEGYETAAKAMKKSCD